MLASVILDAIRLCFFWTLQRGILDQLRLAEENKTRALLIIES